MGLFSCKTRGRRIGTEFVYPTAVTRQSKRILSTLVLATTALGCSALPEDEEIVDEGETADEESLTVGSAGGCSTSVLEGLSMQIIAEANCLHPGAFAELPDRPNLAKGPAVYAFLEAPARDALLSALDAKPSTTMTVNSMLRTPAQQYLLKRWSQQGKCGIGLAASPGKSKHESGLAIDISEYGTWKSTLGARGFKWFGNSDKVHFTYAGAGAIDHRKLGVLAFQRLWNRNHANDIIGEDGDWGPNTRDRMKISPVDGFPVGATCSAACDASFQDLCDSPHEDDVEWLVQNGATTGCTETLFCPDDGLTRAELAYFVASVLHLPPGPNAFVDDAGYQYEAAIDAVAAADLHVACDPSAGRFCPDEVVSRGEIAAWVARAYDLPAGPNAFVDDDGSPYEGFIDALAAAGVTSGCSVQEQKYCPDLAVSRGLAATLLHLASGVGG